MSEQIRSQFSTDSDKTIDSDSDIQVFLNFGFLIKTNYGSEIKLNIDKEEIIDTGLVIGLKQFDNIVDLNFISNTEVEYITFDETDIKANGKSYGYNKVKVRVSRGESYLVSKDQHEVILKLDNDIYDMISTVIKEDEENIVISVINSKICACKILDGRIVSVNPFDIGLNKLDEDSCKIRTKSGSEYNISDCYVRKCTKNTYLHIDDNPSGTLILGKTESSSSIDELNI